MDGTTLKDLCEIIFSNAKEDREKALALYESGLSKIRQDESNHAIIGTVVAKYLERSSKTNDQLLNLMKVLKEYEPDDSISDEDKDRILEQIKEEADDE